MSNEDLLYRPQIVKVESYASTCEIITRVLIDSCVIPKGQSFVDVARKITDSIGIKEK